MAPSEQRSDLSSMIPGVGKALQAAFPVIGGLALAGVFAKLGEEVVKFIDQASRVPQALQAGFEAMHTSAAMSSDALEVSTDKLKNQLAVLQNKPVNMIALALHESQLEADKLTKSLQDSDKAMQSLMKENHLSAIGAALTGQYGTAQVEGTINAFNQQKAHLSYQASTATDPAARADFQKQMEDKERAEQQNLEKDRAARLASGDKGQQANITLDEGALQRNCGSAESFTRRERQQRCVAGVRS